MKKKLYVMVKILINNHISTIIQTIIIFLMLLFSIALSLFSQETIESKFPPPDGFEREMGRSKKDSLKKKLPIAITNNIST